MGINEIGDIHSQTLMVVRDLHEDIRFGRELRIQPIVNCAEMICEYGFRNTSFLTLQSMIQNNNQYTFAHPVNVALVSAFIGKWLMLKRSELYELVCSAILHDIGKAKISDRILNKPEKLTPEEIEMIKTHPVQGFALLAETNTFSYDILMGVLAHHERVDGSGYPQGLKSNQINLLAKIIAVADTYDAMTAFRPYASGNCPFKVIEEIDAESFGSLDPRICQVFLDGVINLYSGSTVRLNNQLIGQIVYINPGERTRPLIRCGEQYLDLTQNRDLEIVELLQC